MEWQPVETAPKDGPIQGLYEGDTVDIIEWCEYRCCILGPRAGSYPPGWNSVEIRLPVDAPMGWKFVE